MVMVADSTAVLDTGAAPKSVCFKWLGRRNEILGRKGVPRAETHPVCGRFKLGDGRLREVRRAADISGE